MLALTRWRTMVRTTGHGASRQYRDFKRAICRNSKVANSALRRGMAEQNLDGPELRVVADGCSVRLRDAPLTPERVLLAREALAEESSQ